MKAFMAEARADTVKQEREEVYVALQYAASFHCLMEEWKDCEELQPKLKEKCSFVEKRSEGMKHRTEWCAEAAEEGANTWRCQVDVMDHNYCQKVWENGRKKACGTCQKKHNEGKM